jgi:hypothetical protein
VEYHYDGFYAITYNFVLECPPCDKVDASGKLKQDDNGEIQSGLFNDVPTHTVQAVYKKEKKNHPAIWYHAWWLLEPLFHFMLVPSCPAVLVGSGWN